jgi:hypothetical protein
MIRGVALHRRLHSAPADSRGHHDIAHYSRHLSVRRPGAIVESTQRVAHIVWMDHSARFVVLAAVAQQATQDRSTAGKTGTAAGRAARLRSMRGGCRVGAVRPATHPSRRASYSLKSCYWDKTNHLDSVFRCASATLFLSARQAPRTRPVARGMNAFCRPGAAGRTIATSVGSPINARRSLTRIRTTAFRPS